MEMRTLLLTLLLAILCVVNLECALSHRVQPLSKTAIQKAKVPLHDDDDDDTGVFDVTASPSVIGLGGETKDWVTVNFTQRPVPNPKVDDWIGVFSPVDLYLCMPENSTVDPPFICVAPIKYQYANYSNPEYLRTGTGLMKFQLINQRADFTFVLFTGGLLHPKFVAASPVVSFANPKAPVYPRLAHGKSWNEMVVTWTSGYGMNEAVAVVEWGLQGAKKILSPAGTLTFDRSSMCGAPASTVGWRDPGYIHTGFMKELWPNLEYTYRVGHRMPNGTYVWSNMYHFKASPYPGQDSVQKVVVFGDLGKDEVDGSLRYKEFNNLPRGSLNTTRELVSDLKDIDMVFHIGGISYANGYLSQWDQFTAQVEPIASTVPYMIASGNHERDWPGTGSIHQSTDSGGECGVLAHNMFYVPAENREKSWYSTDYGMFRFCIADTEHDWQEGTEQYEFIEHCLASVDRQKQPWLVFLAHRVLGYSSVDFYAAEGSFGEPMGRESLQKLWQKYKVDIAIYGHAHNYERTCPIYQNECTSQEKKHYKGSLNGTIHVVAGNGGVGLTKFSVLKPKWSIFRDVDYGFVKLTAFNRSDLLFEYKRSSNGKVFDSFTISRNYPDILACTLDSCPETQV